MHVPVLTAMASRSDSWLQWTLWAIIMSLIMGWVARSSRQPRAAGYARRLQHPPSTLIIGLVCFLFFTGIAIVSNVFANATTTWLTTTVFVGFALLALPIVGDYLPRGTRFPRKACVTDGSLVPVVKFVGPISKAFASAPR
jgi:hypothetical protein